MKKLLLILVLFSNVVFATGYNQEAKNNLSQNDVKSFVYAWFAKFDHQDSIETILPYLANNKLNMLYPNFPIKNKQDFIRWYDGVKKNINWNSHKLNYVKVSGNEKEGFMVDLEVNWQATTYKGKKFNDIIAQKWYLRVNKTGQSKAFIIQNLKAKYIKSIK